MDLVAILGRTLGFSFAAGINLYATVAMLGLASRFGWVELPAQFGVFDENVVIGVAIAMFLVEFAADKIPWVDTAWDSVHTLIRPIGGALLAVAALGEASPTLEGLVALLGGTVAATTHLTKASARMAINTSPEPVSNWVASIAEDAFVLALGYFALAHPVVAFLIIAVLLALILAFWGVIFRLARRRLFGVSRGAPTTMAGAG